MHITKLQDQANGVTTSRSGKQFKFESPIPGVHIYHDVWPDALKFFEKIETDEYWENSQHPGNRKWVREDYLDEDHGKRSKTCWIEFDQEMHDALSEVIDSYLAHWNLDPHSRESLRITKYESAGDFFGMHPDDSFATPRTTSMVYYPNDDYEGGELDFIHFGVKIKPKAGDLFLFPAAYNLEHKVHPIISGTRITIVSFFNQLTFDERTYRNNLIDPNSYYMPDLNKSVLDADFNQAKNVKPFTA